MRWRRLVLIFLPPAASGSLVDDTHLAALKAADGVVAEPGRNVAILS
jgi:hypothetical protein